MVSWQFSQGAGLVMIRKIQTGPPSTSGLSSLFGCAGFSFVVLYQRIPCAITGGGVRRLMKVEDDGEMIETRTAHVWGRKG